nr:hypothetical protein [Tanacetum cinerariifolium]
MAVEAKSNCRFIADANGSCNRWAENLTCGYTFTFRKWLWYLTPVVLSDELRLIRMFALLLKGTMMFSASIHVDSPKSQK